MLIIFRFYVETKNIMALYQLTQENLSRPDSGLSGWTTLSVMWKAISITVNFSQKIQNSQQWRADLDALLKSNLPKAIYSMNMCSLSVWLRSLPWKWAIKHRFNTQPPCVSVWVAHKAADTTSLLSVFLCEASSQEKKHTSSRKMRREESLLCL